jgi:hypothetical protein
MPKYCKWKANTILHNYSVTPAATQIIADHTIVADYDNIPAEYMTAVKKMMVAFPGESHSEAYRTGMELLEASNATYACNVGTGEAYTDEYVRVEHYGAGESLGEAIWYTWYAYDGHNGTNKDIVKNYIAEYVSHNHAINVLGFGWCWDMTWINDPTETKDSVYGCGWAGASDGGPDDNLPWGLDSADSEITGNRVCMDTYLGATQDYINYCTLNSYSTKVVFTTGPVDSFDGENGYQRYIKDTYLRNYVLADSTRILFDYADILCYDDNGQQTTTTWDGHTYPVITTTNLGDGSIGHIGSAGCIRLAKAQWWLLARIAGWNGN